MNVIMMELKSVTYRLSDILTDRPWPASSRDAFGTKNVLFRPSVPRERIQHPSL